MNLIAGIIFVFPKYVTSTTFNIKNDRNKPLYMFAITFAMRVENILCR
jgi:hypothetical protein